MDLEFARSQKNTFFRNVNCNPEDEAQALQHLLFDHFVRAREYVAIKYHAVDAARAILLSCAKGKSENFFLLANSQRKFKKVLRYRNCTSYFTFIFSAIGQIGCKSFG